MDKRYHWKLKNREIVLGERTLVMGILNVTPDSFSDGGKYADPDRAFEKLLGISTGLQRDFPGAAGISAGMSQDLEAAVRFGATHLRIGSDILGSRPAVR